MGERTAGGVTVETCQVNGRPAGHLTLIRRLGVVSTNGHPLKGTGGEVGGGDVTHGGVDHEQKNCSTNGSERVRQIQEAIHEPPQTSARDQNAGDVAAADAVGGFVPAHPIDVARACQREDLQRGNCNGGAADGERHVGDEVGHRSVAVERIVARTGRGSVLILPQNEPLNPTCRVSVVFGKQTDLKQFGDGEGQPDDKGTRDENGKEFGHRVGCC